MKGVILAGGTGSRLFPLTKVINKHLLPLYNKPMIYFPLYTMKKAGIEDVLIVASKEHSGTFIEMLGSGKNFGLNLTYEVQDNPNGIADALSVAENFVAGSNFLMLLGDNLFEDNFEDSVKDFMSEDAVSTVFLKEVENPKAYGVATVKKNHVVRIDEKPFEPASNLATTGAYLYTPEVFEIVKSLEPSSRNELEITDLNNVLIYFKRLKHKVLDGFWIDCGESFESYFEASKFVKNSKFSKINFLS